MMNRWLGTVAALFGVMAACAVGNAEDAAVKRLLYVTSPDGAGGSRNRPGIYVFDIDDGHKLVKYIPLPKMGGTRGCCGSAAAGLLFISHRNTSILCFDIVTEKIIWEVTYPKEEGGADRCSVTPDGEKLYVPEGWWSRGYKKLKVVDGETGKTIKTIDLEGVGTAHNTIMSPTGKRLYVGPINNSTLFIIDTATDTIARTVGPFSREQAEGRPRKGGRKHPAGRVSPYCINGAETLCFVNTYKVGFFVGDLVNQKVLHWVRVKEASGFSHGVGMTPDEKEIWLTNPNDKRLWVFDATAVPPKRKCSIDVCRKSHGWITFSIAGDYAWPDTSDVIDPKTKKVVATLKDDRGRQVSSSKFIEVHFDKAGNVVRMGDQFGIGRVGIGTREKGVSGDIH